MVAIRFSPWNWDTAITFFIQKNPAEPKLQKLLAAHGTTLDQLADIINPAVWEGVTYFENHTGTMPMYVTVDFRMKDRARDVCGPRKIL
jgi:hypothetical protein